MTELSAPVEESEPPDRKPVVDALAAALSAERAGQAQGAAGRALKDAVLALREDAMKGFSRGDRLVARLSRGVDELVRALFAAVAGDAASDIALCAVGGYGRRELAPYSDIDLLILYAPQFEDRLSDTLNDFLYPLWDSGLKLGYAAHTPKSAVDFAKNDLTGRTAYLDARLLCGAAPVFKEFQTAYDKLRRRTAAPFVAAKLKEQDERQARFFETRYLVEPDIKDGKGGLRDLQTIRWLYKYVYGGDIGAHSAIDKIMAPAERRALFKAERFLWSVRAHLHDLRGRADEKMTFDAQPDIAARLGYADRPNMTAAERLMKHYFVNAVEIGRLTRILCARLEEERTKRLPHLPKLLPREMLRDEAAGKPNLRIRNGRLDFHSAAKARRQPRDLFRLFRAYGKNPKIDFHPDALALVAEQAPRVTSEARKDPVIAALFAGVLTDSVDPVRVLRIMTEVGLLGKYIPAFGSIVGRIDYGLYRRFTLDEHVLRCVGMLHDIRRGRLKDEHPIATGILRAVDDPMVFYLAHLLHESGWTVKDRSAALCEKLVTRICRRLGLDDAAAALVGWAAARRPLMVRTAERRNLADRRAIAFFAKAAGTQARLDLIMVLSVCHLKVVGLQSWDELTRRQFTELYRAAAAWLEGGDAALEQRLREREAAARVEVKSRLGDWPEADKDAMLDRLSDDMLHTIGSGMIARFARLARAADADGAKSAVIVTPRGVDLEATVYAEDRPGLLADLASGAASVGMGVRAVQAFTTRDGKAVDMFIIQLPEGAASSDPYQARRLHEAMLAAAAAPPAEAPPLKRRLGDRRALFSVAPAVRIELEASENATVVEAEGLDRPGLLYELASALADIGVVIASAHIATYGERAVDAFYLQSASGLKITDPAVLARIEKELLKTLGAGSGA